jgi:hypothetical protein
MPNEVNRSRIRVRLTGADRRGIADHVQFKLYNQRRSSLNQLFEVDTRTGNITLQSVPAAPEGLAELLIKPDRHRIARLFVDVPSSEPAVVTQTLFVDPDEVTPTFPTWTDLRNDDEWEELERLLRSSGFDSAAAWRSLDDLPKAGLLNIYAKIQKDASDGKPSLMPLIDHVEKRSDFHPDRIFAIVEPELMPLLEGRPDVYHPVNGSLHKFDPPWQPVSPQNSFKTGDAAGNLQLTFAEHPDGRVLADIDLDDHQGLEHAADVLKHTFTGKDTHPYDVHDLLLYFQDCDPGYTLD